MAHRIHRACRATARLCRLAAGAALAALAILVVCLVLARYLSISLPWADELARVTFVWMVALGAAAGVDKRAHFALAFFVERFPDATRRLVDRVLAVGAGALLVLFLAALRESIPAVMHSVMPGTGWSRAWLHAPLVVFALLGSFFLAGRLLAPDGVDEP